MKKIIQILILLIFLSCENKNEYREYYPNGNLKLKVSLNKHQVKNGVYKEYFEDGAIKEKGKYLNGNIVDTVYRYYKNGKLQTKGLLIDNTKVGWWFNYNEKGNPISTKEYINLNGETYENQTIIHDSNGVVDKKLSSFFIVNIPDTISLGKSRRNIGFLSTYNSNITSYFNSKSSSIQKFIWVVIKNKYPENKIKKDTFSDGTFTPKFGIYGSKSGKQKVEGIIIEEVLDEKIFNKDSSTLIIREHKKYFEKEVFVKDTVSK